ncbi:MAG: DEAD/DEAH box helicase [Rubrivivax sp.]|nr:DEAD/DEAH box helicase [Rubrivivax sp.]
MPAQPTAPAINTAIETTTTTFADLGLDPALQQAAAAAGWTQPTDIQRAVVPAILAGRDVLARAPTGAGKTAGFVLPILQRVLSQPGIADERPRRLVALVLAPTRELAAQIAAAAQGLAPRLKTVVAVGGLSINPQMMALRGGAHLLVATPGRLLDLTRQNALRLADLQLVVLDEADRLLDAGFEPETRRVLALLPRPRQTLLFSATLPDEVLLLARAVQVDALHVEVAAQMQAAAPAHTVSADRAASLADETSTTAPDIQQRAIVVDTARRTPLLRHLISSQRWHKVLVFVATQHSAEHVADKLRQGGLAAAALHGDLSQGRRAQVLDDLASGQLQVLVATDLAARGLDVPAIDAVVNHDLPRSATDHTHRIGRTGRAGASGVAVSFVLADAPGSELHFRLIEKRQQLRVAREQLAGFEPGLVLPPTPADPNGGVKGKRPSKKDKLRAAASVR